MVDLSREDEVEFWGKINVFSISKDETIIHIYFCSQFSY
jgi:hypothetical protein